MLEFQKATDKETGRELLVARAGFQEILDPLVLLRSLKGTYPKLWQQVNIEIVVPQNGAGAVRPKLSGA